MIAMLAPAAMGLSGLAEAQPSQMTGEVKIDCYLDSDLKNTGTKNTITIRLVSEIGETFKVQPTDKACTPDTWDDIFSLGGILEPYTIRKQFVAMPAYPVTSVIISTDGDDAFWIDQLRLDGGAGGKGQWGVSGGKGYCLSTDPKDADGAWKKFVDATGCRKSLEFVVGGGVR